MKTCITCGVLTSNGGYCKAHDPKRHYRTPEHRAAQKEAKTRVGDPCRICGVPMTAVEADHLIPLTQGGRSTPANYGFTCRPCNLARRNAAQ